MQLLSQYVSLLQLQIIVTHLQIVYNLAYSKIHSCITQPLNIHLHLKPYQLQLYNSASYMKHLNREELLSFISPYSIRRDVPVGVPLDLSTMEWHELPKYNGIQVSQLI